MLSYLDSETNQFIENSILTSNSVCLQVYYAFMSSILSFFLSRTSINGILNRGAMFLFSVNQLKYFLNIPPDWNASEKRLLDLGAGNGGITKKLSVFYSNVHVTEISEVMKWRLRLEDFIIEDVDTWYSSLDSYDLISVLNLLDRHYNPQKLLKDIHMAAFRSNCPVLIAVVLPIHQFVEYHPFRKSNQADVRLQVEGNTFEQQVSSLIENEFVPVGFQVVRWTKLPYLCEGDSSQSIYVLEDAVFLLHPVATETCKI
ncbi:DREV methyltransferase [Dictyocaulus viviparus]|uniref:DREV methyltransferase n=1 Tax=Dictyocaulus viviparus TaxID=29172 RepID=A0A0D8XBK5_DICVI|nr:DREV methyltransferase [Dictyocaulus viviparus]